MLEPLVEDQEAKVRSYLRPRLSQSLDQVDLIPTNLPEKVARAKLEDELLDRMVDRGHVSMGDLRDAISRNNLKLPDLAGPGEFLLGDRLIRANRKLAIQLDGVYRRGEVYMRWLQRFSASAFGTRIGRALTLFIALPFGGAFVTLEGSQHAIDAVLSVLPGAATAHAETPTVDAETEIAVPVVHEPNVHLVSPLSVLMLGIFFLVLMHSPWVRRRCLELLRGAWVVGRRVLVDIPAYVMGIPAVRRVLENPVLRTIGRRIGKPLIAASAVSGAMWFMRAPRSAGISSGAFVFVVGMIVLNTRIGRDLEEASIDLLVRVWQRLHRDLLPGLFRLIMDVFKRLVEAVDRVIYRVDEWLRFREGDRRRAAVAKAGIGLIWFALTYLVRIYVNLLIEPTVNPIKHFPVVTVAAKVLLPFVIPLTRLFAAPFEWLGLARGPANAIGFLNFTLLPGVFGFLVWELKENWRLYQSNRPRTLKPVVIGHHGETMIRLLRPGIHSGTIPKWFAKLRKAARADLRTGSGDNKAKPIDALHHVEASVRRFVEREFLELLRESRVFGEHMPALERIRLTTNCVRMEFGHPRFESIPVCLEFQLVDGKLRGVVTAAGWENDLTEDQLATWRVALGGLNLLAGAPAERVSQDPCVLAFDSWDAWVVWWENARSRFTEYGKPCNLRETPRGADVR
jgi:hypothetical protein